MKKSFVVFLFIIPFFSVFASSFSDVPKSHQYHKAIKELSTENIIGGYDDGTFKPGKVINRAEFLKIAIPFDSAQGTPSAQGTSTFQETSTGSVEMTGSGTTNPQHPLSKGEYTDCFPDVKDEWFAPYVCYAKEQGWVGGYPDGDFKPGNQINFGEAFAILARIYDLDVANFDNTQWYYPYQRYFDNFNLVGNIEQSIAFQVNRGEMANLVYQVREHLEKLDDEKIARHISEQKLIENIKIDVFKKVNEERRKQGRGELVYNVQLEKTAQGHAEDMVNRNFFAHVNPDGVDVMTRAKTYKYDQRDLGENIALGQLDVAEAMDAWMNSPPHRQNLLKSNYTEMGVGVYPNGDEGYSWVQVFGKPCEERDNMVGCTTRSDYQERNAEDEVEANRWESPFTWY